MGRLPHPLGPIAPASHTPRTGPLRWTCRASLLYKRRRHRTHEQITREETTMSEQPSNAGGRTTSTGGANTLWGSDVIADALREQNIPYACLNPGASYRGLHDSLVNYLGNKTPKMIVCLHEEHAVGIAHGYARRHQQAADRDRALQRRPDARDDGHLQRLVQPRAGRHARRHRPGRCHEAPAVDRLDPHLRRPGRAGPRLHQVGRPAGLARRRGRIDPPRVPDRAGPPLRPGLRQPRRRHPGDAARRRAQGRDRQALRPAAPISSRRAPASTRRSRRWPPPRTR